MTKAGDFEIRLMGPYSGSMKWSLLYQGEIMAAGWMCQFDHLELTDLKYVVEKAMQMTALAIGRNKVYL
jgi:hypothetical protein